MPSLLLGTILAALAQDAAPLPPTKTSIRIVYTGNQNGVSAGRYAFLALEPLQAAGTLRSVVSYNGALVQGPWALWTDSGRVQAVLDVLGGGEVRCGAPEPVAVLQTSTERIAFDGAGPPAALRSRGEVVAASRRRCESDGGAAWLLGPATGAPDWALSSFEFRRLLRVEDETGGMWMVGLPIHDAARIFARIAALRAEPGALFVDAGSFVDGASAIVSGGLSLHRPLVFETLEGLGPNVLVPGESELVGGPERFFAEAAQHSTLPYIATNWHSTEARFALPGHATVSVDTPAGPVRLAFLGMLDPSLLATVPALAAQGITITDPIPALQAAADALYASDAPPDAILVLTTAPAPLMEEARRRLHGVDLMMGDQTFATIRVGQRTVRLRDLPPAQRAAPLTLSLDGAAVVDLQFAWKPDSGPALEQVTSTPQWVRTEQAPDPATVAAVTQTRARVYPPLDVPLLPAFQATVPMEQDAWEDLICEAVRDAARADTVFLSPLPPLNAPPGPMTLLQVAGALTVLDTLQVHTVSGASYASLLDKASGMGGLVACGATAASKKPQGRSIDTARFYRVVSTSHTTAGHPIGALLDSAKPVRPFDPPASVPLRGADGQPAPLRGTALDHLQSIRDSGGGPEAIAGWLAAAPGRTPPMWTLRVRQLSAQLSDFQGTGDDAFSAVPETLATSPSSFTLGSVSDVSIEHSAASVSSDLRLRTAYTRLQTDEADEVAEAADDVRISASLSVPAWALQPAPALGLVPYTELLFDSELTPTTDEDGSLNSRQADLSLALGLSSKPWGMLTAARLGGFANRDMAQLSEKPTEFGGKLDWATSKALGTAATWTTTGDLQLFGRTPDDDSSDLRFRGLAETRLSLPLASYLSISLYAQGFVLKGRTDETDGWGAAHTFGATLDVVGAFTL